MFYFFFLSIANSASYTEQRFTSKLSASDAFIEIASCLFVDIKPDGALEVSKLSSQMSLTSTSFHGCETSGNGGAISYYGSQLNISSVCVNECKASEDAGGIFLNSNGNKVMFNFVTVTLCQGEKGTTEIVSVDGGISNLNSSSNKANTNGAGLIAYTDGFETPIKFCSFYNNGDFACLFFQDNSGADSIESSNFVNNRATNTFFMLSTSIDVTKCIFIGNTFSKFAGYVGAEVKFHACKFDCTQESLGDETFDKDCEYSQKDLETNEIIFLNTNGCEFSNNFEKGSVSAGSIIGIILGSLGVVALVAVLVFYLYKARPWQANPSYDVI